MLDVEHDQIRQLHKPVQLFEESRVVGIECDARAVYASMDILFLSQREQLDHKFNLHQGLSAGDGETAAVGIEGLILFVLLDNVGRLHQGSARHFPSVGVVTIGAAHGTSLHEPHEAGAGAVHCSEAFQRMNSSLHKLYHAFRRFCYE